MLFPVVLLAAVSFREPAVVPPVREMDWRADVEVRLDENVAVTVRCPSDKAAPWVARHFDAWYGLKANVKADVAFADAKLAAEGYRLKAAPGSVEICARDLQGVRHAMYTIRQIAERDSSGRTVSGYRMPALTAADAPALKWRGVHFCWFPEVKASVIEREIRLAAYYKFNHAVIESWGTFRSARHPWLSLEEGGMTRAELARLRAVADDVGITLVPGLNVLGHASYARESTGKHVVLDRFPERAALFEPMGGWNWCLANPESTAVLKDVVDEMHESFGRPPYFHIGCDEAEKPSCASCRAGSYADRLRAHLEAIRSTLSRQGARCLIWRSMLLPRHDPRYAGFFPGPRGYEDTVKVGETLPKDIVVCDACYGEPRDSYPMLEHFLSRGYDVITCPWNNLEGIRRQSAYARQNRIFGLLQTTWHRFGGTEFADMMLEASFGAWSDRSALFRNDARLEFATHWRECTHDAGIRDFAEAGYTDNQAHRLRLD